MGDVVSQDKAFGDHYHQYINIYMTGCSSGPRITPSDASFPRDRFQVRRPRDDEPFNVPQVQEGTLITLFLPKLDSPRDLHFQEPSILTSALQASAFTSEVHHQA